MTARVFNAGVLLFAALWWLGLAHAATTGAMEVHVVSAAGEDVRGAEVTLLGERLLGGPQVQITGDRGRVTFANLLPGNDYRLVAEHTSGEARAEELTVFVNQRSVHVIRLNSVQQVEVQQVSAIEKGATENRDVLTREMLKRLPAPRTVEGAIGMSRGALTGVTSGGNPSIMGSASDENTVMVDGVNITDPVTGTFASNFNYDAIEQLEVLLGGYMPEHGVSLGGVLNIVTASGSNTLEFDSSIYYTNGNWRPRMDERVAADGVQLAPSGFENTFSTLQVGARVSGPIVRDKAFFMLSYQHSRSLIGIAGTPQPRDFDGNYVLGKLTVQPSSAHRFTAMIQMDPTTVDNTLQGSPFIKGEAQGRQSQGGFVSSARWLWSLGKGLDIDTGVSVQKSFIERSGVPCSHDADVEEHKCRSDENEGAIDWETPGRSGVLGAYNSVNNVLFDFDDRMRLNASSKLSWRGLEDPLGGMHDLKFGVEGSQLVWDKTFGVNGNLFYVDLNSVPFDPESFENFYWVEYSKPFAYRTTGSQQSFFAQDSYRPVDNLTINFGFRFDRSNLRNDLGDTVLDLGAFGPRLFAAWDPWGDNKTKVATGWGRFADTGRLGVADFTSASGFGTKLYLGETYAQGGTGFLNQQDLNLETIPNENASFAHDTLRNPFTDELMLILEREVAPATAISSRMTGRFTRNLYEFDDTSTIYDEDGTTDVGTRLGQPEREVYRVRTPSLANRTLFKWDLEARKVLTRRWAAQITYSFTQIVGTSSRSLSGAFANGPQTQFARGRLPTAQKHVVRALALWDLPLDPFTPQIGVFFVAGTGIPIERRAWSNVGAGGFAARTQSRGTYTTLDPFWDLSVRIQQTIDVRKGAFRVSFEAQNITNNRAGGRLDSAQLTGGSALDRSNRAVRVERQDPLRLTLGAQYEF